MEERRRRLLAAAPGSDLALQFPALVKTGQNIIHNRFEMLVQAVEPEATSSGVCGGHFLAVTPLIKPVGDDCNLRCRYCTTRAATPTGRRMSLELLEKIIQEVLSVSPLNIDFIFHGGEPLLARLDFFQAAVDFQKRHTRRNQVIRNHIQTNGMLITRQWAQFFAEHDFFVSVSLDGPGTVHDASRVGPDGSGTHEQVMEAIDRLQQAGARIHAIAVVPPRPQIPASELLAFIQDTGIPSWRVNHCRSRASIDTYPVYIQELFQAWMTKADVCSINMITESIEGLLGYPVHTCWMKGSCSRFIGFEPDGSLSPCCEMPVPTDYAYGNAQEQPIQALLTSPAAKRFQEHLSTGTKAFHDCQWQHLCGGGCAFTRIEMAGSLTAPDPLCQLYQGVFSRLTQSIDTALGLPARDP